MNTAYKNIFKATTLFGGVQGLNILLNLARTKLVAIFLGPAGVGLSSIFNETRELIHESTNLGMDQSGVREISVAYEQWKETGNREPLNNSITLVRTWVALFALLGALVCLLFAYPLSLATFGNADHWINYMLLSPAVAMATITCGEMAILKATRKLKVIASLSTINILVGACTNIPLYYLYGMRGIIPAIMLFGLCQMIIVMYFSFKDTPPKLRFEKTFLLIGKPMLILGGAFVIQGFLEHGTKLAIQAFINNRGSLEDVGFYNTSTMIISVYLGIFASSIAADYYPRLSGIFADERKRALTVSRQIDVIQMLTAPMLMMFLVGAHIIVPLLLSEEFTGIIPILEIALASCLMRSVSQPLAFMPLAAGNSKMFLFVDIIDFSIMFACYTTCYALFGLIGLAYGICLYNLADLLWVVICMKYKYNVQPNIRNVAFLVIQTLLLIGTSIIVQVFNGVTYWLAGILMILLSVFVSFILYNKIRDEE
ncbi:MAG: oligosaccharide flippase family protein [Prevotella sp.]|nr:oligosaccharide flippase family protein [Prevotella sp.]MBQ8059677.1 oligosaccharide flippase family protein [Prevotella sp.]